MKQLAYSMRPMKELQVYGMKGQTAAIFWEACQCSNLQKLSLFFFYLFLLCTLFFGELSRSQFARLNWRLHGIVSRNLEINQRA